MKADNDIVELEAQLDALTYAVGRGSEERIIVVFDATRRPYEHLVRTSCAWGSARRRTPGAL